MIKRAYYDHLGGLDNNTFSHTTIKGDLPIIDGVAGPLVITNDINAKYSVYISGSTGLLNGESTIGSNQYDKGTGGTGVEIPPGATKRFDLPYQTKGQPIDRIFFSIQYWDPNRKTPPDTSVSYTGDLKSVQISGQLAVQTEDKYAKLLFLPQPDQTMQANVTYGDGKSKWIESCSVKINSDGTMTLRGASYQTLYGSTQFSLDTFTLWQNADGTVTGQSSDGAGGGNSLLFHRGS